LTFGSMGWGIQPPHILAAPHDRWDEASLKRERPTLGCRERAPRGLKAHASLAYAGMPEFQVPGELVCPEHFPHDRKKSMCVNGMIVEPNKVAASYRA